MRKIITSMLLLGLLIIAVKANAQKYTCEGVGKITTTNYGDFIGKTIYILPDPSFKDGTNSRLKDLNRGNAYPGGGFPRFYLQPIEHTKAYKGKDVTSYDALAGKHFKITDIQFKPPYHQMYIQLAALDSKDVFYYSLDVFGDDISNADLFVFDDCLNVKNKNEGKTFVAKDDYIGSPAPVNAGGRRVRYIINDVNTGRSVKVKQGSEWKCVKVLENTNYILSNSDNTISVLYLADNPESPWLYRPDFKRGDSSVLLLGAFYNKEEAIAKKKADSLANVESDAKKQQDLKEQAAQQAQKDIQNKQAAKERMDTLTKKYGVKNAGLIVDGQVAIGFTEQMCIDSWGTPYQGIHTTIIAGVKHEQWVYDTLNSKYLYFENGILTAIQN